MVGLKTKFAPENNGMVRTGAKGVRFRDLQARVQVPGRINNIHSFYLAENLDFRFQFENAPA